MNCPHYRQCHDVCVYTQCYALHQRLSYSSQVDRRHRATYPANQAMHLSPLTNWLRQTYHKNMFESHVHRDAGCVEVLGRAGELVVLEEEIVFQQISPRVVPQSGASFTCEQEVCWSFTLLYRLHWLDWLHSAALTVPTFFSHLAGVWLLCCHL